MLDLNYQRVIVGYHGCDAAVVAKVLSREGTLSASEEDYDWLGPGSYFWEHGPQRAYDWAMEEHRRDPKKIKSPSVLGAYINLGQCFDLLDTANTRLLQDMYPEFRRLTFESGRPMPKNTTPARKENRDKVLRYLDCAVVKFSLDKLAELGTRYHRQRCFC